MLFHWFHNFSVGNHANCGEFLFVVSNIDGKKKGSFQKRQEEKVQFPEHAWRKMAVSRHGRKKKCRVQKKLTLVFFGQGTSFFGQGTSRIDFILTTSSLESIDNRVEGRKGLILRPGGGIAMKDHVPISSRFDYRFQGHYEKPPKGQQWNQQKYEEK